MHVTDNLSWLKVEESLTAPLLVFVQGVEGTTELSVQAVARDLFTVPRSRTEACKHTVLNRAMTTWNSLVTQVTLASNKTR